MRVSVLSLFIIAAFCFSSFGQNARMKRYTAPLAGTVVLKNVEDKYNAGIVNLEMPEPGGEAEQEQLRAIKKQVSALYPHKIGPVQKKTSSVAPPVLGINFVSDSIPGIPPDNGSAMSKDYKSAAVVNSSITIQDASTGTILNKKGLKQFSASVGLNRLFDQRFDPKLLYDQEADRFICIMLNNFSSADNGVVIGFSRSNNPADTWNFYAFTGNFSLDTTWFDYPAIAITKQEFFFTGNHIKDGMTWQAGFTRSVIYQINKQGGYNGDAVLNYQIWDSVNYNGRNLRCLHPVTAADTLQAPAQYFLSNRNFDISNDSVFLVKVPDTIGSIDSVLTVTALKSSTGSYGVPPDARQPDTSLTLATNDGRILGAIIKNDRIQFVSATSNPGTGNSALYHGFITNIGSAPAFHGEVFSFDTLDIGYPNISYVGNGLGTDQTIISFEYSGLHTYPGLGAILYDGTGYSDMTVIRKGDSTIRYLAQKEQRWGDYTASQPDWSLNGAVWVCGNFGRHDRKYGNYMAQLISPYHTGVNNLPNRKSAPVKLYPNPAGQNLSYEFTVTKDQVFSFFIYDLQGRLVDKLIDNFCTEGINIIRFNTGALPQGTYVLKGTGSLGETVPAKVFERKP